MIPERVVLCTLQGAVSLEVHQMGTSRSGYSTFQVAVSFDPCV